MVPPCFCEPIITPISYRVTTPSVTSAFFIDKKLGIFAVFFVGANENKIHIGDDAKASVTAEFAFKLISQIGGIIVKEFDGIPVGEAVFQIHVAAHERVEFFDLRHSFNTEGVDLVDQFALEFFKLSTFVKIFIFLPIVKFGEHFL